MISLARTGPESIAMKLSSEVSEIRHKLGAWGTPISLDAEGALRRYGPTRRLVFLTAPPKTAGNSARPMSPKIRWSCSLRR